MAAAVAGAAATPAQSTSTADLPPLARSPSSTEHDSENAQDGSLAYGTPYAFGATPTLESSLAEQFVRRTVEGSGALLSPLGVPYPTERRHKRPDSLVSRGSTASMASSTSASRAAAPRPFTLPPGLAANSPLPPSSTSGASTLRPGPSPALSSTGSPSYFHAGRPARGPRNARVAYEPPIPLDVQWLLMTTPPPPRQKPGIAQGAAARQRQYEEEAGLQAQKARKERDHLARNEGEGLIKRLWASRLLNGGKKQQHSQGVDGETDLDTKTVRALDPLDLSSSSRRTSTFTRAKTGRLDSTSGAQAVPKSWSEYEGRYAAGDIDIEDPPFPPLSANAGVSTVFPPRFPSSAPALSPYEAAHFPAPLHLSPTTPIRESLLAKLDLLGERIVLPPPPSGGLPPIPSQLSTCTAISPSPSAASASSAASTVGQRDSLLQQNGYGRRDSAASTAPSSAWSPPPTAPSQKYRSAGTVFPSRTVGDADGVALSRSALPMQSTGSTSSADGAHASLLNCSLSSHPPLLDLLTRALAAPLGSRALFNPVPKAAMITLFPASSRAPDAVLSILASINLPAHVQTIPLSHALDAHTLLNGERGLAVTEAARDWRWRGNALVRDAPSADKAGGGLGIRFYAGMPIFAPSLPSVTPFEDAAGGRIAIGTVAVLDDQPRLLEWGTSERAALRSLASEITAEIERFLVERDRTPVGRRSSASSTTASFNAAAPPSSKHHGHVKKVSFDRGSTRRDSIGPTYVDWDAQLVASSASATLPSAKEKEEIEPTRSDAPSKATLPPLLASSSPAMIYTSACTSLASTLELSLVYLVELDLSTCEPAPSLSGSPTLSLLAAHNLPTGSNASFDPSLHLRALRAPEGGLLYRSPTSPSTGGSGFASGVLLPVAETDTKGWVLAGYTTQQKRRWADKEMDEFEKVRAGVAKVVLWQDRGGWGPGGGKGDAGLAGGAA
ncbi:hypothetical protein JCM10213_002523 [Rhodosporidiobolus nylandii]